MGRKLAGKHPKPATLRQRRWRENVKRRERGLNARGEEWGTPPDIILAVREAMGGIDLDPASHPEAQARVKAARSFTKADNGLIRDWPGRVFLNPPFTRGVVDRFAVKLLIELAAGRCTEAIVLTNAQTGAQWFLDLRSASAAHCFLKGRIHFLDREGGKSFPTVGQMAMYFGPSPERFAAAFAAFGDVVVTRPVMALAAE